LENMNTDIYSAMFGPSEFFVTGTLKEWDITPRLGEIDVPTLITSGRYDEATPAIARTLRYGIPRSNWVLFEERSTARTSRSPSCTWKWSGSSLMRWKPGFASHSGPLTPTLSPKGRGSYQAPPGIMNAQKATTVTTATGMTKNEKADRHRDSAPRQGPARAACAPSPDGCPPAVCLLLLASKSPFVLPPAAGATDRFYFGAGAQDLPPRELRI